MVMNNKNSNSNSNININVRGSTIEKVEEEKEMKRMLVGIVWKCAAELKLVVTAIVFLCSLALLLQFLPAATRLSLSSFSSSSYYYCATNNGNTNSTPQALLHNTTTAAAAAAIAPDELTGSSGGELQLDNGVIRRGFNPYGSAAYNFILMSTYRGGPDTFAIVGLSSKPLHIYGKPSYKCLWIPHNHPTSNISTLGQKILPDWGYGRVYTVVLVNCTFSTPVGTDGMGGHLLLLATTNDPSINTTDTIIALHETPQKYANFTKHYTSPRPKYDYLYCGSSLYGNLSPQRVREWLAYHIRLFGPRSHFVIHDAGGVHEGVMQVLKPWMEKGFITLQDIRDQERFDGYYHNQFLIVNDCLHRYRFEAKWIFFFDVDEFIYVPNKITINSLLDSLSGFTQFTIEQMTMSNKLCLSQDAPTAFRKWGFEKLVYKDVKKGIRRDRKYAVQPRNVFATGVHMSQNSVGKSTYKTEGRIKYFHYHGTISERHEPCRQLINTTAITVDGIPYVMDTTMRNLAGFVKRFELQQIGSRLQRTRQ